MVVAAVIAIVLRRRQGAARSAATAPDRAGYQRSSGDDGQHRPISAAPGAKSEYEGQQGSGRGLRRLRGTGSGRPHARSWRTGLFRLPGPGVGRRVDPASRGEWLVTLSSRRSGPARPPGVMWAAGTARRLVGCRGGCAVRDRGGGMRAVTVVPGTAGSLLVEEVPEPDVAAGVGAGRGAGGGHLRHGCRDRRRPIRMATAGA